MENGVPAMCLKEYVDQGIQTEASLSNITPAYNIEVSDEGLGNQGEDYHGLSSTSNFNKPLDTLATAAGALDNAYTRLINDKINITRATRESSRSPCSSRRVSKTQLLYNGPSESLKPNKRVISLPEISHRNDPRMTRPNTLRIVSLPERRLSNQGSKFTSLGYVDTSYSSGTELSYHSSGEYNQYRPYPCDIPVTPSPPSSPESIMIIGNNTQVPNSFLRHKVPQASYQEEDGWISWASSPPRPIPALHGPLSLPYARCPSGAEGTVIEGEDLSHMIWGLNIDNVHGHQKHLHSNHLQKPPAVNTSKIHKSQQISRTSLPRPSALHDRSRYEQLIGDPDAIQSPSIFESRYTPASRPISPTQIDTNLARQGNTNTKVLSDLSQPQETSGKFGYWYKGLGLGLNWDIQPDIDSAGSVNTIPNYGAIAQKYMSISPDQPMCPRIIVEPRDILQTTKKRLSAFEIAQQYAKEKLRYPLPTPPSSSSPKWSPRLPHFVALDLPQSQSFDRKNYEPQLPTVTEHLENIKQGSVNIGCYKQPSSNRSINSVQNEPNTVPKAFQLLSMNDHHRVYHEPSDDSMLLGRMNLNYKYAPVQAMPTPPSPTSLDIRRMGAQLRPRSIPLAKLIHRRLSSVTEEDAFMDTSELKSRSPMHTKETGFSARSPDTDTEITTAEPLHISGSVEPSTASQVVVKLPTKRPRGQGKDRRKDDDSVYLPKTKPVYKKKGKAKKKELVHV